MNVSVALLQKGALSIYSGWSWNIVEDSELF
ncbi:MAG: hypothetical protein ACI9DS_001654 [Glaciecola sp.]|jgi:hypothetical protein